MQRTPRRTLESRFEMIGGRDSQRALASQSGRRVFTPSSEKTRLLAGFVLLGPRRAGKTTRRPSTRAMPRGRFRVVPRPLWPHRAVRIGFNGIAGARGESLLRISSTRGTRVGPRCSSVQTPASLGVETAYRSQLSPCVLLAQLAERARRPHDWLSSCSAHSTLSGATE